MLTIFIGTLIDKRWLVFNFCVNFNDFATDWTVEFTGSFYRLQGTTLICALGMK